MVVKTKWLQQFNYDPELNGQLPLVLALAGFVKHLDAHDTLVRCKRVSDSMRAHFVNGD